MVQRRLHTDVHFRVYTQQRYKDYRLVPTKCLFACGVTMRCPSCESASMVRFDDICLGVVHGALTPDPRFTREIGGRPDIDLMSFCSVCGTVVHLTQESHNVLLEKGRTYLTEALASRAMFDT